MKSHGNRGETVDKVFETDPKNLDEIKKEFLFSYWK
jgi:hypothetical protein